MAIVSVIKYDGDPDVFAWKHPDDELGTWTQLIVNESQQAILFKGGQALDVFEAGRHTLSTKNIPFLEQLVNLPFGGDSPFKAEVWFINKVFNLDVKWGTPTPIQIQDPTFGILVPVRSNGQFALRIDDPKMFLVKLVGTLPTFTKRDIQNYFRGLYITRAKDAISTFILERGIDVLSMSMYLDELSQFICERIAPTMEEYGIALPNFYVNDISIPEDDPAVVRLRNALAKKAEMDIIGYTYVQERSFDTLEGAATNEGSMAAPMMGAGLGMGMGFGMGAGVGNAFTGIAQTLDTGINQRPTTIPGKPIPAPGQPASTPAQSAAASVQAVQDFLQQRFCGMCGTQMPTEYRFCPRCGHGIGAQTMTSTPDAESMPQSGTAQGGTS